MNILKRLLVNDKINFLTKANIIEFNIHMVLCHLKISQN